MQGNHSVNPPPPAGDAPPQDPSPVAAGPPDPGAVPTANFKQPSSDHETLGPSPHPPASTGLSPGSTLGSYQILERIGAGGMGAVWKARHTKLDKVVALKVLPNRLTQDPAVVSRFEREMKAVGKLEHPHIVRAMDAGEHSGTHFLVMEFADGQDLGQLVKSRGPRKPAEACEMIRQAALALGHAHQHGLVHRDVKPGNLLLSKQGKIKLLDLGLARLQGDIETAAGEALTSTGQIMGTPDYMAPEQWDDCHAADGRADLYALGCTLFFLLTGRAPYSDEQHKSMARKIAGHTVDPIPSLTAARPDVPPEVEAIYQKLMAKQPGQRYAKAEELVAALTPIVRQAAAEKQSFTEKSHPEPRGLSPRKGTVQELLSPSALAPNEQPEAGNNASPVALPLRGDKPRGSDNSRIKKAAIAFHSLLASPRNRIIAGGLGAFLLLADIIIKLKTADGTIVIEVDDPRAEVELDDNKVLTVKRSPDGKTITLSAAPGPRRLRVTLPDGTEFVTDVGENPLDIKSGQETRITARLERSVASLPVNSPIDQTDDPERRIAEWVLEQGGSIRVHSHAGRGGDVNNLAELPPGPIVVFQIALQGKKDLPAEKWPRLRELKAINDLVLGGTPVNPHLWEEIGGLHTLRSLSIGGTGLTDADLEQLSRLTRLEGIDLTSNPITDKGIKFLVPLTRLQGLSLNTYSQGQLTNDLWQAIGGRPRLERLLLYSSSITNAGMRQFPKFPRLNALSLMVGSQFTDEGLDNLSDLPELRRFDLNSTTVTAAGIERFACRSRGPLCINFDGIQILPADVPRLQKAAPECVFLHPQGQPDPEQQAALDWLRSLEATGTAHLSSRGASISERIVEPSWIEDLFVGPSVGEPAGWEKLRGIRGLRGLHLSHEFLTDAHMQILWKSLGDDPRLKALRLWNSQLTDTSLTGLDRQTRLTDLSIDNDHFTDEGLAAVLPKLSRLRSFDVEGGKLTDRVWSTVAQLRELTYLRMSCGDRIRGVGLDALRDLRELQHLHVVGTAVEDQHLAGLAELPELTVLELDNTPLTDAGLAHMARCQSLRVLCARGTEITAAGVAALQKALPKCTVFWMAISRRRPRRTGRGILERSVWNSVAVTLRH